MFNKIFILFVIIIKSMIYGQCFDYELAVSDFPFNHLADLTSDEDIGVDWDLESIGGIEGNDFAYKITLLEPALIYITTCDSDTDVDVEIGIYNSCDQTDWILYQDDSNLPVYYPDGTSEQYDFQCISGYVEAPTYANMLPRLDWSAGTYYIVIGDRGYSGTVRTYIGYSLLVDSTTTNDDYSEINYHFSEGVYGGEYQDVYSGNGIPLEISDYSLSISSNGGNANEAYITSLTTLSGDPISINESDIKINIDYPDIPSGVEEVTIGPASVSSIFNSVGIPLLNVEGISILLEDASSPTIISTVPVDNAEEVPENLNISLTFSEEVFYNNEAINNENASNCFKLEVLETGEELGYVLSNSDNSIFSLNPENSFPEYTYIRLVILSTIEDGNDNSFANDTITFRTEDMTPPQISNSVLSSTNSYILLTFSENVYSDNSESEALNVSDLSITYNSNGGNCDNVSLLELMNSDGNPLEGGESLIQVFLQLVGAPSGVETFSLSPSNSSSIFDLSGNAMSSSSSSPELTLFASALIEGFSIADSNEFVDLTFSVGIYGDGSQIQPVSLSDFNLQLNTNNGPVSSGILTNIKNINNDPLLGGEEIIRIFVSFDTLPSGVENIIISPNTGSSIYSISGVPVPSSENTGPIHLIDQRPPEVEQSVSNGEVGIVENEPLRVTFSELLYNPITGELISSEELSTLITLRSGDSSGTDIPFSIDYTNPPDLFVIPNEDFDSEEIVYYAFNGFLEDQAGNPIEIDYEVTFTIRDYLPPTVDSSILALDNSYLDLIFDDGIFGAVEFDGTNFFGITPVDRNDFTIEFEPNGSETDSVEITSITRTDSNFLIGGENEIRINFEYNGSPDGNETLRLLVQQGVTMYDEVGNQMTDTTTMTQEIPLYDILAPTINSVSVPIDSFITLMEERPITFTFNERIDSLEFKISSIASDSVYFDSLMANSDSSIEITLKPPFTSYDQITVEFTYLEDNAGISTVDIAYTYMTPMLGDYDFDNSITYSDLWDLVENWESSNMDYEIGPVIGEVPHVIPVLDSKFDIEDGMAFVQMWSWYQKEYGEIIEDSIQVGRHLNMNQNNEKYTIMIDSSVVKGQLKFSYQDNIEPIEFFDFPNKNNSMFLQSHIPSKGFSILEFARPGILNDDSISIKIRNSSKVNLFYSFEGSKDSLISKGMYVLNKVNFPDKIKLYPAYPNPFNPTTTITFDVPMNIESSLVSLSIYDLRGRQVSVIINSYLNPGVYSYQWSGSHFSSGMYIAKLRIDSKQETQKIILLK
ncbi:MAG: Ig-like domain-containing protein [Candidatus Neomarinimicrobiota bacterium]